MISAVICPLVLPCFFFLGLHIIIVGRTALHWNFCIDQQNNVLVTKPIIL